MREDCKHYESRTYSSGEVVRMCRLDLAPEAPWRCPVDCPKFERRMIDAGWTHGTLVPGKVPKEPEEPREELAAILDAAEDIINEVGPSILAEVQEERERAAGGARWWKRRPKGKGKGRRGKKR